MLESMAVSREKLHEEIWAEPITKVAKRYDVSDSFLVRVCKRLNVPRPPMGYWAKLAAGATLPKALLPKAKPGDEVEWSRNGTAKLEPYPPPKAPESLPIRRIRKLKDRPSKHSLIAEAPMYFKEVRQSRDGYLKPNKKLMMDLIVSEKSLSRGLELANELYLDLEDHGHHVALATYGRHFNRAPVDEHEQAKRNIHYSDLWNPGQPTLVFIGTVAIGLTLFEMSEQIEVRWINGEYIPVSELLASKSNTYLSSHTWTTTQDRPTGRFCLQAYSPYSGANWQKQWRESKPGNLQNQFKSIVATLEQEAGVIVKLVEEAERLAEIRHQQWELERQKRLREEAERKRLKDLNDSKADLLSIIEAWAEAKRISDFFTEAETRAHSLSEEDREILQSRLIEARELLGDTDVLRRFKTWKTPKERS